MSDTRAALPEPVDADNAIPNEYPDERAAVWTETEVASILRVKRGTVYTLYRCGDLEGVKVGKHLRFLPGAVRAFVAKLEAAR